jgi:predicted Fe-Mo cluster-binding NifX family protein
LTLKQIFNKFIFMRIAITFENENVFQHFGHTKKFKIYDVENNSIVKSEIIDTNGSGHGALATFLKERDVQVLICGGIGGGAQDALNKVGIKIYGGVQCSCDKAANDFIAGTLEYNPDVKCNHHGEHHHHDENHNCGNHSCSSHDDSAPKYIPIK